jgi:hypothetical protein
LIQLLASSFDMFNMARQWRDPARGEHGQQEYTQQRIVVLIFARNLEDPNTTQSQ